MMARVWGLAVMRSKWAFFLPVRAVNSLIALMIGWMAVCANARASMKRSSGIWSAEPSIISMSLAVPT